MVTARCPICRKKFSTRHGAYLHWQAAHYRYRLGQGERAVLDDMDGAEEREAAARRKREETA